jgi:hypothetical protein
MTKLTIDERIKSAKEKLFEVWKASNGGLGVKRSKLVEFMSGEKKYIKRKVIAQLRKEKVIYLMQKRYLWRMNK